MTIALLEDKFGLYKHNNLYHVTLYQNSLSYYLEGREDSLRTVISVDDIIGCSCMKAGTKDAKDCAYLTVFAYPLSKRRKRRVERPTIFEISKSSYDESIQLAKLWRNKILDLRDLRLSDLSWLGSADLLKAAKIAPLPQMSSKRKKLLILINPKSGAGTANEIFMKKAKPILEEAEIPYETIITHKSKYAYEFISAIPAAELNEYSGIVTVSGDGLLYEVFKGLLNRDDCTEFLSFPVGSIPGGSGNGLVRSLGYLINEPYLLNPVLVSTLNIVNPVTIPLDLTFIQTQKEQSFSFLSVGFGLMSDIDIESEILRALGEARFTIWGIRRALHLRKYRVRVSFKRAHQKGLNNSEYNALTGLTRSQTFEEISLKDLDESEQYLSHQKRCHSLTFNDEDSTSLDRMQSKGDLVKIARSNWAIQNTEGSRVGAINGSHSSSVLDMIDSLKKTNILEEPLPPDWETIEDDFISIYAAMVPYLGTNVFFSPHSKLADGIIYLSLMDAKASRINVLKYLIGLDNGKHMNVPGVEFIPVTGFRLEPLCKTGYVSIDGEHVDFGPLHAMVVPSAGRFLARPSHNLVKM